MQLKRLWDTEGKKIVFTEGPTGHQCQVWTDESGNLYIYDMAQWLAYNGTTPEGKEYDRSNWVELTDQTVGFYDTNEATDLYHWDHGDDAYYEFVDWDGTVLKSGTVIEGGTPTAPADPTRPSTEEYTYTFAGWEPAVGPITKRTTYTATYTAIPIPQYTVTIQSNDTSYGTVDNTELTVREGTTLSASDNVLTVGTTDVTATAETGYEFVSWTVGGESLPATVTSNMTITATFQAEPVPPQPTGDYRYIKWHVTGTWNTGDPSLELSQIMASRFVLTDGVNEMTYPVGTTASTNATNDGSAYSETPANLLDGSVFTKMVVGWGDTPYSAIDVTIDLGSGNGFDPTEYDHYQWYTANDSFGGPEVYRNPVSWEIQLSEDGTTWETWDTQTNATLNQQNESIAGTWSLTAPVQSIPVQSMTFPSPIISGHDMTEGDTDTYNFTYTPTNADDFSGVVYTQDPDNSQVTCAITSYSGGAGVLSITAVEEGSYDLTVELDSTTVFSINGYIDPA